jgi:hypothetical protein
VEHFTVYETRPDIDAAIRADLDFLSASLRRADPGTQALVLVGGFGRGEGSVLIEGDQVRPVNDYDLVMVTTDHVDRDELRALRRQLADSLSVTWVDVTPRSPAALRRLPFTIYNYDLKYGSRVLYGDPAILAQIPSMDPRRMPLVEAELQFFTRLWCFLGAFSTDYLAHPPGAEAAFFLTNQMSKAILACVDTMLIIDGQYHHSYRERRDRFLRRRGDRGQLAELARWAAEFKLRPTRNMEHDPVALWRTVRSVYLQTWLEFAGRRYRRLGGDWQAYAWRYRWNGFNLLRRLGHLILRRSLHYERKLRVDVAQLYLLLAFDGKREAPGWLARAKRQLMSVAGHDVTALTWDEARALVAGLRMEV